MKRLLCNLVRFWKDRRGSIAMEVGAAVPFLMIMVMTGTEFTRYLMLNQKLDRAANSVADLVSQEETITEAEIAGIFDAVTPILSPFSWGGNGTVVITSISRTSGVNQLNWQRAFGTSGATSQMSAAASGLPSLNDGETVIVGEAFYNFTPFFPLGPYSSSFVDQQLYHRAFYRTRVSSLSTVDPN